MIRYTRELAHQLVQFLETIVDPAGVAMRNAPFEDEEISQEEEQAAAEAREWLKHHKPIWHEEVLAELELTMGDFEQMGRTPLREDNRHQADARY